MSGRLHTNIFTWPISLLFLGGDADFVSLGGFHFHFDIGSNLHRPSFGTQAGRYQIWRVLTPVLILEVLQQLFAVPSRLVLLALHLHYYGVLLLQLRIEVEDLLRLLRIPVFGFFDGEQQLANGVSDNFVAQADELSAPDFVLDPFALLERHGAKLILTDIAVVLE